ncbi:MAG: sugar ABC transporter permease [Roseibium album]|uniref:ABC transporter permease subunit n=1 Tax=Roseibium album TaxID=311410 RepID=UPI000CF188E5|nr:sorbitol/mannitol transport system permease protein [Labrenzia sp. EL_142]MBG6159855.1 sorbitol/mannitol transport system permease protein [Labrenzia sp. EL_162]MBG6165753.1 sorbitol/mannitol transport system permease protein [Labrenzia sp. EL_195]MBG6198387.1 sorbitol/mannitol transport system permease protein [Labrenzia sp. EL_159]MBG6202013.1 sorbitol/mannitol transport system permease protein [Labrenzia sp. EL_13]MBG6211165.1 sorbitol/mannitol transport system permease protein [Labrenzi
MSTKASRSAARMMISPAVLLLLGWMLIPLCMTVYFSFLRYNLLQPGTTPFAGWENYYWFVTDPSFKAAITNTLAMVGGILCVTTIGGIGFALLLDKPMFATGFIRIMVIAPFFVMPTVSALVWKNMFMNPVNGIFGNLATSLGFQPIDFFGQYPLASIIFIVSWMWLPFATLILLTALQSLDQEQLEAAEMDGAGWGSRFWFIMLPHLARAITVVILIQTIFLLSIFAEILVTTNGGPGTATTNLTYLIYVSSLLQFDVGMGSAGGVIAIILANIVAIFLMRMIGKNLDA